MGEPSAEAAAVSAEPIVRVGTAGLPAGVGRAAYFSRLDFLELDVTRKELPREAVLRRWRKEAGPRAALALQAPHRLVDGGLQDLAAREETVAAARAVGAEAIVLNTPATFSPSSANREALRRFASGLAETSPGIDFVWEPRGVWEPEVAARFAEELGLVYACDPLQLEVTPPEAPRAYFRILGLGLFRNRISEDQMDVLAELVERYDKAWVVFANADMYRDAQRFARLLGAHGAES